MNICTNVGGLRRCFGLAALIFLPVLFATAKNAGEYKMAHNESYYTKVYTAVYQKLLSLTAELPGMSTFDDCCDQGDKPQKITATYTGESCSASMTSQSSDKWDCGGNPNFDAQVYIIANDKDNPNEGKIWFSGPVSLNGEFVIDATLSGEDDLSSATFVHIFASQGGALLQMVEFHTSCSQPLSLDDQYGAIAIDGILFKDGSVCGATPPQSASDCCDLGDKPQKVTVTYTGESCSATATSQPSDKWDCSGDPNFDLQVYIIANDKDNPNEGKIWFSGDVSLNSTFVIDATSAGEDDLSSATFVHIFASQGGSLLQMVEFHTSCSQPLSIDDQYGAIAIEFIEFKDGATCGQPVCTPCNDGGVVVYNETNCGPFDPALIEELEPADCDPPAPPVASDCCDVGDKPQKITVTYTGESCSATVTTQDDGKWDCSGNPNFDNMVYIIANDDDNPNSGDVWFSGNVSLNGSFVIDATAAGEDDLSSATFVHIFASQGGQLLQMVEFHTSCSQPLSIDDQYGAIDIEDILFKDGSLCSTGGAEGSGADCCDQGDKPNAITFIYTGEDCSATVTSQPSDKWNCNGNPNSDPMVYIVANDNNNANSGKIWFTGNVDLGETYTITSANAGEDDFSSNTVIHIFSSQGGTLIQKVNFHTSCSQPLSIDDQYGANEIVSIEFKDGFVCGDSPDDGGVEYQWISSTEECPTDISQAIPGATGPEYDPPFITETTFYVRLVRRTDCVDGENPWLLSNCIVKEVEPPSVCAPASLGDKVFEDLDGDGIQDPEDPCIPGIPVKLKDCDGNVLEETVTDADGLYLFDNLNPGQYKVCFGPLGPDCEFTIQDAGNNEALDSDVNENGETDCIDLAQGEDNRDVDAGFIKPASIGDKVFEDLDGDGIQDPDDPCIPGIPVKLQDCEGNTLEETVTDADGLYLFDDLAPGQYRVCFGPLDPNCEFTVQDAGGDEGLDSDADENGITECITLGSGEENLDVDAGFTKPASLGDKVFEDLDGDGIQDPDDPCIPGIPVKLKDCDGNVLEETVTDADGLYLFDNLEPGQYKVCFGPLGPDCEFTTQDAGNNDALDSDADENGETDCVTLTSGEENLTVDAGFIKPASIGDKVFEDKNGDGIQDPDDPCIPGIPVKLQDCEGNILEETVTDADGLYLFDDLEPGQYRVCFGPLDPTCEFTVQDAGGNEALDSDADENGITECITLTSGEENLDVDAGFTKPASLGDKVFEDVDGDGIQDPNEPCVPGIPVKLKDCEGNVLETSMTDADGLYLFDNLDPGQYKVCFGPLPEGFEFTEANAGNDDAIDSDANDDGETDCVELESGEEDLTVDAGIVGACGACRLTGNDLPVCPNETLVYNATITEGTCDNPVYLWEVTGNATINFDIGTAINITTGPDCGEPFTVSVSILCEGCGSDPVEIECGSKTVMVQDDNPPVLDNVPGDETIECNVNGCITFDNGFVAGDFVSSVFADNGFGPVLVNGSHPLFPGVNAAMIFDSSNPTGGDPDLGSPNEDFGGPGIGTAGEAGMTFENNRSLGNVLIVSEDLDASDPDDAANTNTFIEFDFSAVGPLNMISLDVMDFEIGQGPYVDLLGAGDALLASFPLPEMGDNGLNKVDLGNTAGVMKVRVVFNGSGAVNDICFSIPGVPLPAIDPGTPTAEDDCDPEVDIMLTEETTPGDCPGNFTVTRTWTATDDCDNSSQASQVIEVVDTEDPVLCGVPEDMTVSCDNVPVAAKPVAKDNCDPNPIVFFMEDGPENICEGGVIVRVWTAVDNCGNSTMEMQTIEVNPAPALSTPEGVIRDMQGDVLPETDASEMAIRLFPVPSNGIVTLEIDGPADPNQIEARIFNLEGKLVYRQQLDASPRHTLDLSDKGTGIFVVQIISGDEVQHQRIIIQ